MLFAHEQADDNADVVLLNGCESPTLVERVSWSLNKAEGPFPPASSLYTKWGRLNKKAPMPSQNAQAWGQGTNS